jgi:hypothetical protein
MHMGDVCDVLVGELEGKKPLKPGPNLLHINQCNATSKAEKQSAMQRVHVQTGTTATRVIPLMQQEKTTK